VISCGNAKRLRSIDPVNVRDRRRRRSSALQLSSSTAGVPLPPCRAGPGLFFFFCAMIGTETSVSRQRNAAAAAASRARPGGCSRFSRESPVSYPSRAISSSPRRAAATGGSEKSSTCTMRFRLSPRHQRHRWPWSFARAAKSHGGTRTAPPPASRVSFLRSIRAPTSFRCSARIAATTTTTWGGVGGGPAPGKPREMTHALTPIRQQHDTPGRARPASQPHARQITRAHRIASHGSAGFSGSHDSDRT
jgi:hypothetical protein